MSDNISEILPLSPGHSLRGAPITAHPEGSENLHSENLSRWKKAPNYTVYLRSEMEI